MADCRENVKLYRHIRKFCYESILFTFFQTVCERPPADIGFGIPILQSNNDVRPLLNDIGLSMVDSFKQIIVLYEDNLDLSNFHEYFYKALDKDTIEYRLESETGFEPELVKLNQDIISECKKMQTPTFFIVISRMILMEKIVKTFKTSSALNNYKNKWSFIVTDSINTDGEFKISPETKEILSISDVFIVRQKSNRTCIITNLQQVIVFNLIKTSIEKIFNDRIFYQFMNGTSSDRIQIKNRLISEFRVFNQSN